MTRSELSATISIAGATVEMGEDIREPVRGSIADDATPLDDFEPIVPVKPLWLSNLVLEDRR